MDAAMSSSPLPFILSFIFLTSFTAAQQPYANDACTDNTTPSASGYNCNGANKTCQAYLIFRAQTPYTNLSSIANLLSSDPSRLAKLNSLPQNATLKTNQELIIPVTCSCSAQYYQSNTTYVVQTNDIPYTIATTVFESLTTCQAIKNQLGHLTADIFPNQKIIVPLRCACPTKNQTSNGVRYLLTYIIQEGDTISQIAIRFGADVGSTLAANDKSDQDTMIDFGTTLLVPLQNPPNSSQTRTPQPQPPLQSPLPPPPSQSSTKNKKWDYFAAGAAAGACFVFLLGAMCFWKKRKKEREPTRSSSESFETLVNKKSPDVPEMDKFMDLESISSIAQSTKVYTIKDLRSATENFSPACRIKGNVYRGRINGNQVAVKKTDGDLAREISLLNKINHFNIIGLLGVCFDDGQWYLVYEYALNGPLSSWINLEDRENTHLLSWTQRIQIALDVATGLDYLHSYTNPPHVHRDIKTSNVLLDADMRGKITNFRSSKSFGEEGEQFALTRHIVGTKGYMAPEYIEDGLVSPKMDVYAFGVLMLEVLSGRGVADLHGGLSAYLSEIFRTVLDGDDGEDLEEKLRGLIDPRLEGWYPAEVGLDMVRLIERCLKRNPGSRPAMSEIANALSQTLTASLIWEANTTATSGSEQLSQGAHGLETR